MPASTAREAYERLAPAYDILTADYRHDRWLAVLEALAREHGLSGHSLLDVACGTGKSFLPLLARGYRVVGCDISPAMLARAAEKAPQARLVQADMRTLGRLGAFDLVTCLDDALNYLVEPAELEAALAGIRRNLQPEGIAIWDLNTLAMYRSEFATDRMTDRDGALPGLARRDGRGDAGGRPGAGDRRGLHARRRRPLAPAVERPPAAPLAARRRAERSPAAPVCDCSPSTASTPARCSIPTLDELVHSKAVYLACRDDRPAAKEVVPVSIGSI